jgi:hypothetical protein
MSTHPQHEEVTDFVHAVQAAGYEIVRADGELMLNDAEETVAAILAVDETPAILAVDETRIRIQHKDTRQKATLFLVLGNEPGVLLSYYAGELPIDFPRDYDQKYNKI